MDLRVWIQMNKEKLPVVVGAQPMPVAMHMSLRQEARRAGARSHINDDNRRGRNRDDDDDDDDRRGRSSSSGTRKRDRYGRFTSE